MKRFDLLFACRVARRGRHRQSGFVRGRSGFTLVEMLVATTLTLVMMGAAATIFGKVGMAMSEARSMLEMGDRLRTTAARLSLDFEGATVHSAPPIDPGKGSGYLEIREGPIGPVVTAESVAQNTTEPGGPYPDTTVGDIDDVLMFTARSRDKPFVGRVGGVAAESELAEIVWFVRGHTLYRRVLLILPLTNVLAVPRAGFYQNYDLSAHLYVDPSTNTIVPGRPLTPNTLGDLTKRECRFAHDPRTGAFPGSPWTLATWQTLALPTLSECSAANWWAGNPLPALTLTPDGTTFDAWANPHPYTELDTRGTLTTTYPGARVGDDVMLNRVISFNVEVWDSNAPVFRFTPAATPTDPSDDYTVVPGDPGYRNVVLPATMNAWNAAGWRIDGYGAYVDLNYANGSTGSDFDGVGNALSGLNVGPNRVYDTWSTHYESDGVDQFSDGVRDTASNGFDDNNNGIVDDWSEYETMPPYPVQLRGVRVTIRVFDPDTRRIRQMTIKHDFLTK